MGNPRFPRRFALALAVCSLIALEGCVAGGPLQGLIGAAQGSPPASPEVSPEASSSTPAASSPAATPAPQESAPAAHATVSGHVLAGPVCPVETVPPNPSCAPRPVAGATVIATNASGHEVGRAVADSDGFYSMHLDPGAFTLATELNGTGMMKAPVGKAIVVPASGSVVVDFLVDTGVR